MNVAALLCAACLIVSSAATAATPASGAENNTMSRHPVYELRQYTLHPGRRDAIIELFEDHLIEPQEAHGMQVLAHFRDLDNPDRFVWFRGFDSMTARGQALPAFYLRDPAWQAHRSAANATMIDSDNVLLLREAWPGSGFAAATQPRPPVGTKPAPGPLVVVTAYALVDPVDADFIAFYRRSLAPRAQAAGAKLLAAFASEESTNNFPPLPVRPEHVLVWVAAFPDAAAYAAWRTRLDADPVWRREVLPVLAQRLIWPADVHRLAPAGRSLPRD